MTEIRLFKTSIHSHIHIRYGLYIGSMLTLQQFGSSDKHRPLSEIHHEGIVSKPKSVE